MEEKKNLMMEDNGDERSPHHPPKAPLKDKLTGLYNDAYLTLYLEKEIKRSKRYRHPLALILVAIDGFRDYNDQFGHPAGDEILRELGRLILENVREMDLCFCYGVEKFVIVLPYSNMSQAMDMAERLRKVIDNHGFISGETDFSGKVTASMGIAAYPTHAESMEELVRKADEALHGGEGGLLRIGKPMSAGSG